MSKRINVNPDHYKMRGRERPGRDLATSPAAERVRNTEERDRWERKKSKRKRTPPRRSGVT